MRSGTKLIINTQQFLLWSVFLPKIWTWNFNKLYSPPFFYPVLHVHFFWQEYFSKITKTIFPVNGYIELIQPFQLKWFSVRPTLIDLLFLYTSLVHSHNLLLLLENVPLLNPVKYIHILLGLNLLMQSKCFSRDSSKLWFMNGLQQFKR